MSHQEPIRRSRAASIEQLADGWDELARQLRFLALRGTQADPETVALLHKLVARGSESIRALSRGEGDAPLGLRIESSQRGITPGPMQSAAGDSGCSGLPGGERGAPSRTHMLRLQGSEGVVSAQEVVGLVAALKKTGVLKLRSARELFTLEIEEGKIAHLETGAPLEGQRVGELLVQRKVIDAELLANIRRRDRRGRIGDVLLRGNFVREPQLREALTTQMHLLVGRLASAQIEWFAFWEGPLIQAHPRLRIELDALLLAPWQDGPSSEPPAS